MTEEFLNASGHGGDVLFPRHVPCEHRRRSAALANRIADRLQPLYIARYQGDSCARLRQCFGHRFTQAAARPRHYRRPAR